MKVKNPAVALVSAFSARTALLSGEGLIYTIGYNLAKATATVVVLFWNFIINRIWTYSDVK